MIEILFWLFLKHFIIDFPLQTPFQYKNKGTYGHPGGLLHSGMHGVITMFILSPLAGLIDAVVHYHIDWTKIQLNKRFGWGPTTHEQFWWLLGLDQFLHSITYLLLVMWFYK